MIWYRIFANLENTETNETDVACGYKFELPLDDDMRLVVKDWETSQRAYKVTRFWREEPNRKGHLLYLFDSSWCIDYGANVQTDFPIPIGGERLALGDKLHIRDIDNLVRTYRIVLAFQTRWFPSGQSTQAANG